MKVLFCVECNPPVAIAAGSPSGFHTVKGIRHKQAKAIEVPDSPMTSKEQSHPEKYLERLSKEHAGKVG